MHHDERPIAFFDSGVGGLPYLDSARNLMPTERFVYAADRDGFPYGTKSKEQVVALSIRAISALIARTDPKALVVACNTATELAIDEIRAANPGIPVIGTVPAIKPAAALSATKRIGVIATPAAAAAEYLSALAREFAADCELVKIGDGALVDFVERRFLGSTREERIEAVAPSVRSLVDRGVDTIVLGCTHFLHLSREFREAAGPGIAIVDSRDGISTRLKSVLGSGRERGAAIAADRHDAMYLTGLGAFGPVYGGFAALFRLECAGTLE
ncbi:MAG: glutamate racemase [Spirochaetae bacterium HGW-Spirochaetae-3]|jgi:glutamate racemase|nr:MAG: glutamate racemase [Spirochaetae bacterium HGW-Spirochaetae-3]